MNKDDDIKFEYEKKLVMVRLFVVSIKERGGFRNELNNVDYQQFQGLRCRISLDDLNDLFFIVMFFKGEIYVYICYFVELYGCFIVIKKGVIFFLVCWLMFEFFLLDI